MVGGRALVQPTERPGLPFVREDGDARRFHQERRASRRFEAQPARDQHPGAADPQLRCLQSRRQQMGELVRALSHADARVAEGALAAAQSLPSPQVCTDILALAHPPKVKKKKTH